MEQEAAAVVRGDEGALALAAHEARSATRLSTALRMVPIATP
jgi:hypothetical protein